MADERDQTDIQEAGQPPFLTTRRPWRSSIRWATLWTNSQKRIYHLSDPQTEYQIRDRLSFRDFLGLASGDKVPDEKTIWAFKEELTKKGLFEQLFDEFYAFLEENNLIMHEGTMLTGASWRRRASATPARRTN